MSLSVSWVKGVREWVPVSVRGQGNEGVSTSVECLQVLRPVVKSLGGFCLWLFEILTT